MQPYDLETPVPFLVVALFDSETLKQGLTGANTDAGRCTRAFCIHQSDIRCPLVPIDLENRGDK